MTEHSQTIADDQINVIEVNEFDYEGYQVVRGEFFAHMHEPSFVFNKNKVYVNSACVKKLPDTEYVQILVNPDEHKLAVRPCRESDKDSFRWKSSGAKVAPRQITCKIFYAKVFSLMGWDYNNRYKLLGKLIKSSEELLFIFDLNTPEIYEVRNRDGKAQTSRIPSYPEDWKNQFGISVKEHQANLQISIFDGNAVFGIQKDSAKQNDVKTGEEQNV